MFSFIMGVLLGSKFILIALSVLTVIHLFAFFTFKVEFYKNDKKIHSLQGKIKEQSKILELIDFTILNAANYKKINSYAKQSSEFQTINLSDVSFYNYKTLENNTNKSNII